MDVLPCRIPPNPDISGIGVRASIYAQAALASIIVVVAFADGNFDKKESRTLKEVHKNQLITSCALLAAALVQAGVGKLSIFHTLLVLDLCWINVFSTLTFDTVDMIMDDIDVWKNLKDRKHHPILSESWHGALAWITASAHMTAVCALGLWFWIDLPKQTSKQECSTIVFSSLAGHTIPILNKALRISYICFYGIFSIPVANIFIYWAIVVPICFALVSIWNRIYLSFTGKDMSRAAENIMLSYGVFTCSLILQIIFIIDIEVMIHRNRPFLGNTDNDWSFGQNLALFLLVSPLLVTVKMVYLQFIQLGERRRRKATQGGGTDEEIEMGRRADNARNNSDIQSNRLKVDEGVNVKGRIEEFGSIDMDGTDEEPDSTQISNREQRASFEGGHGRDLQRSLSLPYDSTLLITNVSPDRNS